MTFAMDLTNVESTCSLSASPPLIASARDLISSSSDRKPCQVLESAEDLLFFVRTVRETVQSETTTNSLDDDISSPAVAAMMLLQSDTHSRRSTTPDNPAFFNPSHMNLFEMISMEIPYPSMGDRIRLSRATGLSIDAVTRSFRNLRYRKRRVVRDALGEEISPEKSSTRPIRVPAHHSDPSQCHPLVEQLCQVYETGWQHHATVDTNAPILAKLEQPRRNGTPVLTTGTTASNKRQKVMPAWAVAEEIKLRKGDSKWMSVVAENGDANVPKLQSMTLEQKEVLRTAVLAEQRAATAQVPHYYTPVNTPVSGMRVIAPAPASNQRTEPKVFHPQPILPAKALPVLMTPTASPSNESTPL